MREDMAKILVERPRGGGWWKSPNTSLWRLDRTPLEDLPVRESMRKRWRHHRKWLNENLAPLRRFFNSRVGKEWNDVNSEIRERINMDSAVQFHIWQHAQQYVCLNTVERDGFVYDSRGRNIWHEFYVEPNSGILRKTPSSTKRDRNKKPDPAYKRINYLSQCRKLNGIWFMITLKHLPYYLNKEWDVVFKDYCIRINEKRLRDFYGQSGYATSKRQLNKKEIAALKLNRPSTSPASARR